MLRMAECAALRGHEVTIVTGSWEGKKPIIPGIKIEILSISGWSNHSRAKNFVRKFSKHRRNRQFDVSIGFNRIPGCDFYFAADNCYAVEMPKKHHRLILKLLPRYRTYLNLERRVFSPDSKTGIFYITSHQKRDYTAVYNTQSERFYLLPPGMNPDCRRPEEQQALAIRKKVRQLLNVADDQFFLLLAGSNFRQKGGDRAIIALNSLVPELKAKCRLFFAGADKPGLCGKLVQQYHLEEQVHFLGARTDLPDLLLGADILLLPARNEATGTVLVEAISSGIPVIASGECGFANFVSEAGSTALSEPWSQERFNLALKGMLSVHEKCLKHAVEYSRKVDFTRRADCAVDLLEEFYRSKQG